MALYLKCPNCGEYFEDRYGEFSEEINGEDVFYCPVCQTVSENVDYDDYVRLKNNGVLPKDWMDYKNESRNN